MIIAFISALLLIGGAVFYAMHGSGAITNALEGGPRAVSVAVPPAMTSCISGDTCILVDKSCGLCCDNIAINGTYEKTFNLLFSQTCERFRGTMCRCAELAGVPACINSKCALVPLKRTK